MTYDRNPSAELNELRQAALAYLAERHVMAPGYRLGGAERIHMSHHKPRSFGRFMLPPIENN